MSPTNISAPCNNTDGILVQTSQGSESHNSTFHLIPNIPPTWCLPVNAHVHQGCQIGPDFPAKSGPDWAEKSSPIWQPWRPPSAGCSKKTQPTFDTRAADWSAEIAVSHTTFWLARGADSSQHVRYVVFSPLLCTTGCIVLINRFVFTLYIECRVLLVIYGFWRHLTSPIAHRGSRSFNF